MIDIYDRADSLEEMKDLAHRMEEYIHHEAVYVPGHFAPFYRLGAWRWIRFPDFFDVPLSGHPDSYGLYWVDTEMKERIESALRSNETFEPYERVFDQWKSEPDS